MLFHSYRVEMYFCRSLETRGGIVTKNIAYTELRSCFNLSFYVHWSELSNETLPIDGRFLSFAVFNAIFVGPRISCNRVIL